ncbi:MAG: hypothetical protein U0984_08490 [Prosthecobacter sp.]|nr:hypothetical protein [Prosthecobacter sp.]
MSASIHTLAANFNGGLMTPRLGGRFDLEKLRTGCVQLKNMLVTPYGGVFKRPGTLYQGEIMDSDVVGRLIPFRRSLETNFKLELGDGEMRIWNAASIRSVFAAPWVTSTAYAVGDLVRTGSVGAYSYYYCLAAHTSGTFATDLAAGDWYETAGPSASFSTHIIFPSPYTEAELYDVQYVQLNDVLFLAHPNHFPRRLSRYSDDKWVLESVPFEFAPVLDPNETTTAVQVQFDVPDWGNEAWVTSYAYVIGDRVLGTNGASYTCTVAHTSAAATQPITGASYATVWAVTAFVVGARVTGSDGEVYTCFSNHTSAATNRPMTGATYLNFWNLGTSSVSVSAWVTSHAYTTGDKVRVNKVIYEAKGAHTSSFLSTPPTGSGWTYWWKISSAGTDLAGLAYKLVATEDLFTSDDVGSYFQLSIGTTGRFATLATNATGPTDPLFIQGGYLLNTNWAAASAPTAGALTLEESLDGVTWARVRQWSNTSLQDGNIAYEGEAPSVGAWYRMSANYTGGAATEFAKLDPANSTLVLPFKISTYTSATVVKGELKLPNAQLPPISAIGVSTTVYRKPAFSPTQGYPRTVAFHDSRLWWAGTTGNGSRIWASQIDDYYTCLTGADDDAGLDLTLAQTEANDILWMASHNRALVVGTTGQEWTIDGGETEAVITPAKLRARMRTRHGSHGIAPEVIAESLLWVTRGGTKMREFAYNFQADGYTAPDMTQLIAMLDGSIVQTAYQSVPLPIIWAVTDTGKLYSFTYDREQNITAWAMHTTGEDESDRFESVAVVYYDGLADSVNFIVKRTVGGVTKRYVENLELETLAWILGYEDRSVSIGYRALSWVDCSLFSAPTNNGADCDIISMSRLEGRQVMLRDGNYIVSPLSSVVTSGDATFTDFNIAAPGAALSVGLPYTAIVQAFPIDLMLQDGTSQGRNWRINRAVLLLHDSLGGGIADTPTATPQAIEYPAGTDEPFQGRVKMYLPSDWGEKTEFTLTHTDPTPFGLLGYILITEVSGQ